MKSFACGDVVPGCDARFVCRSEDEVLVQVAAHAASAHGIAQMTPSVTDSVLAHTVSV